MARLIPLVGGPRDGQSVPYVGPTYQEPVGAETGYREYALEVWSGDGGQRYVLRTTDLGQRSFDSPDEE